MKLMNWLSGRCFRLVHGNQLVYNTCWEDPRLDRVALELSSDDVICMITSAGCNALDYVLQAPRHIHAVDMNPRQNALLELKIAAVRELEYDQFFAIFGRGALAQFPTLYHDRLRNQLTAPTRKYWDRHANFFQGAGRRSSFYFRGTTGYFAWLVNSYIDRVANVRDEVNAILSADSVDEQRRIYEDDLQDAFWNSFIRWFVRRDSTMSLLGVPRPQREQIDRDYSGGVAKFVEDCVQTVFGGLSLRDNYFWRVYLTGRYTADCCPEYLRAENFDRLKSLVDRISMHTTSVANFLQNTTQPVSRYVLLDHMDWLSANNCAALQEEWQAIADSAAPNARILYRSAGLKSDFIDRVEIDRKGGRQRVGDLLTYNRPLADELHKIDRVHTYGSFHIADLAA